MSNELRVRVIRTGRPHPEGMLVLFEIDRPFDAPWLPMEGDEIIIRDARDEATPADGEGE